MYKLRENPPFATINNVHVLSRLSILISSVQAFIVLPLGQRALAGQSINFPVNVSVLKYTTLPRSLNAGP